MKTTDLIKKMFFELIPILIMIALVPFLKEMVLSGLFLVMILIGFKIKYEKKEIIVFLIGFIFMTLIELFFISTGVETFTHNRLFGIPLWLPLIWGYGFVVIKRVVSAL
ncbi:MAG: hypothetical protein KAU20_00270 [Nanoarchaeota archaeon]|nr:hypothetical protein [Nanoarchaeota archaeon]